MAATDRPSVLLIGGPNGSGKSTYAQSVGRRDPRLVRFVNADVIAKGLGGSDSAPAVIRAGRLMLEHLHALAEAGESFSFEATLAGRSHARFMRMLRDRGFLTELTFVGIDSVGISSSRVAQRAAEGGHNIPLPDIERRFSRVFRNLFDEYLDSVDTWSMYNNSGPQAFELIAEKPFGQREIIHDSPPYQRYRRFAGHGA